MMDAPAKNRCPDSNTLTDYLLGKLDPLGHDDCEAHISDCDQCHETLRGLHVDDTFAGQVAEAIRPGNDDDATEDHIVQRLVDRLTDPNHLPKLSSEHTPSSRATAASYNELELMADRAAEVLRCLETDDVRLGRLGDYELIRLLGTGSSGVVFLAQDPALDRTVAIKVLRPSLGPIARERFIAEAKAAAKIDHPNVIAIYQVGQQDRLAFMVMKWAAGETLEAQLRREGTLPESEVRRILIEVAGGLEAAQQQQMIHRDIKPANIWVAEDGSIQLLDFGLARVTDDDSSLTATGMLAGTPNYMSPEQTKGLELDSRSDLFSLGCVAYRALTGKLPFGGTTILGTLQAIQHHQPQTVQFCRADVSDELNDITMALLEKQPQNRPDSAEDTIQLLSSPRSEWRVPIPSYHQPAIETDADNKTTQAGRAFYSGKMIASLMAVFLLVAAGWLAAPQIIRIATDQGELIIETNDSEDIQIEILENGKKVRVIDVASNHALDIKSGQYEIKASSKSQADVRFEVSPQAIKMTRGGKQIVKVNQAKAPNNPALGKLSKSDLEQLQNFENKARYDRRFNPAVGSGEAPRASGIDSARYANAPIYNGYNFAHWLNIAQTDRHPETFSEAIAACAILADTPKLQQQIVEMVRVHVRKNHLGTVGANKTSDIMLDSFLRAFRTLPKESVASFALKEHIEGNDNSLAFCAWLTPSVGISQGELPMLANDDRNQLTEAYIKDLAGWIDAACQSKNVDRQRKILAFVHALSFNQPMEQLIQLAPQLEAQISDQASKLMKIKNRDGTRTAYALLNRFGVNQLSYVKELAAKLEPARPKDYQAPQFAPLCDFWLLPWPNQENDASYAGINIQGARDLRLKHRDEIDLRLRTLITHAVQLTRNDVWKEPGTVPVGQLFEMLFNSIYQHSIYCTDTERNRTLATLSDLKSRSFFDGKALGITDPSANANETKARDEAVKTLLTLIESIRDRRPSAYRGPASKSSGFYSNQGWGGFGGGGFGGGGIGGGDDYGGGFGGPGTGFGGSSGGGVF